MVAGLAGASGTPIEGLDSMSIGKAGHHDHAAPQVRAAAHGRAAGDEAHLVAQREGARRKGGLVEGRQAGAGGARQLSGGAAAEADEDGLLDPGHRDPAAVRAALGGAHAAGLEVVEQRGVRRLPARVRQHRLRRPLVERGELLGLHARPSLPLDRRGRLAADVVDDAVDARDLVDDAVADIRASSVVRQAAPSRRS